MMDLNQASEASQQSHALEGSLISAEGSARQLAQGIVCGKFNLAFRFDWARQIVEGFEMVALPRAPGWVLGAVNINGAIVPIIDLDNYFSESTQPAQAERGQRLLVGGIQAEDAEAALAVVFLQSPVQLEYVMEAIDHREVLPQRLLEVCRGIAKGDSGKAYLEIDVERLMGALSIELSVI